jgi:hypothetical protein
MTRLRIFTFAFIFSCTAVLIFVSPAGAITISSAVQREVLRNPDIRNCYARSESGQAKKKGRVVLTLDVDRSGKVTAVSSDPKSSSLKEDSLHKCLIASVKSLILPLSSKARNHKNTLPLAFVPPK